MHNPFKRKRTEYTYEIERERLLNWLNDNEPTTDEYHQVMNRLNELDKMINRTSELKKTLIPALGTVGGVAAIYTIQQFAGVIIPKALDALPSRQQHRSNELD